MLNTIICDNFVLIEGFSEMFQLQPMSNAIICVDQRFSVKNSGISCLFSKFDLLNLK